MKIRQARKLVRMWNPSTRSDAYRRAIRTFSRHWRRAKRRRPNEARFRSAMFDTIVENARVMALPFNVLSANCADYSFSSARLMRQEWNRRKESDGAVFIADGKFVAPERVSE